MLHYKYAATYTKIKDQVFIASNSLLKICIYVNYNINFQYLQRTL